MEFQKHFKLNYADVIDPSLKTRVISYSEFKGYVTPK